MESLAPGLHASAPFDPFGQSAMRARTFLVQRPEGNVMVGSAAGFEGMHEAVASLGGVVRQYLTHAHEASVAVDAVRSLHGAPLHVHADDAAEVSETVRVDVTFDQPHVLDGDFEVIPSRGHTPGSTSYLWRGTDCRVLFTGDTIYLRDGEWIAAVLDGVSDRDAYVASLRQLAALEFDMLAPGFASAGQPPVARMDPAGARRQICGIADRLAAGEDR